VDFYQSNVPLTASTSELNETLINCEQVLVAAVNGPAAGYGTSSITLFDLVYAVPDAYFFTPFVRWGLCCEGCSSVTFSRIMGHQKAAALILAGDRMSATDAEKAGLVTKILPKDTFMDDVLAIARRIATYPAGALRFNKNLMMRDVRESLLEANRIECEGLLARGRTDEPKEAIKAFALEQSRKRKGQSLGSRL
jgi:peroxisomal 3,2-trans-enoyl-CoA isomerase